MRLDMPAADGTSLRTHLQRAARAGAADPMLAASRAPLPSAGAALWQTFIDLRSGAGVTHAEIESWERLNRVRLSPWDAETLMCIDRAARRMEEGNQAKGPRQ